MRRECAALLVLIVAGVLVAVVVAALAHSVVPRSINPNDAPDGLSVRAWQPVEVTQEDGTRVWIVSDRGGSLMPPFILVPPTPAPGPPPIPAYSH